MQAGGQDYVVLIYERPVPNYYCPALSTSTRTEAGYWRRDQRADFRYYNANRHRWPWPEQGIKSVGQHPMGEL